MASVFPSKGTVPAKHGQPFLANGSRGLMRSTASSRRHPAAAAHRAIAPLRYALSILFLVASSAHALSFGDVAAESARGQTLRAVVPITLEPGDELFPQCFRLVPTMRSPGVPELTAGRISIERVGGLTHLVISSARP